MKKNTTVLSTAYLAPIEYYVHLVSRRNIIIEKQEYYIKQSYRNRCIIATSNGLQVLTVPVVKYSSKSLINNTRISNHNNRWQHIHWHAIVSAYNSTPFFQYYKYDFAKIYSKKQVYLFDFNEELQKLICSLLNIKPKIYYTKKYLNSTKVKNYLDLRNKIHPKKHPFIKIFKSYFQRFENIHGFNSNLSIIDLLFNTGTEATKFLIQ